MQRRTAALLLALAMLGCSSEMAVQTVTRPNLPALTPRAPSCALTVYGMDHVLDASCVEVGDVYVGDTGFSRNCGLESVHDTIRAAACRYGADAAQIVSHHEPTFFGSTCHQVRARFLVCRPEAPDAV